MSLILIVSVVSVSPVFVHTTPPGRIPFYILAINIVKYTNVIKLLLKWDPPQASRSQAEYSTSMYLQ